MDYGSTAGSFAEQYLILNEIVQENKVPPMVIQKSSSSQENIDSKSTTINKYTFKREDHAKKQHH
jgi:hypothetical protein